MVTMSSFFGKLRSNQVGAHLPHVEANLLLQINSGRLLSLHWELPFVLLSPRKNGSCCSAIY